MATLAVVATGNASLAYAQESFDNSPSAEDRSPSHKRVTTVANWEDSDPVPVNFHVETRPRKTLIIEGAGILTVAYAFSCFSAAGSSKNAALWIPVAGPIVRLAQGVPSDHSAVDLSGLARGFLVFDALVQVASATMITYGFAAPKRFLVRNLVVAPVATERGGIAFALAGTF